MGQFVLWIDGSVQGEDLTSLIGGKGAGLVSLMKLGIPVPPAFAITADGYTEFLSENQLESIITDALEQIKDWSDNEGLRKASDELRKRIVHARMPDRIREEIVDAYRALKGKTGPNLLVAVRSSATAEDLPTASFAGQQETYLNVKGEESLLDSVKRCWASVWTARSMAYRHKSEFAQSAVRGCVVVQEMFPSESSGVLFTVNPITGDTGEIVVNSSWGLGEAIVSGLVNPDEYILDKASLQIKRKQITDKRVKVVRASEDGGTREMEVEAGDRQRESIGESDLRAIAGLAKRIEDYHGWPQDIEWGVARGEVSILQARPVTGVEIDFNDKLEAWNRLDPLGDDKIVWSRTWADAFQTGPSTPLMYTLYEDMLTSTWDDIYSVYGLKRFHKFRVFRWYKNRPYYSAQFERERMQLLPKFARNDELLRSFPPSQRAEIRNLPFKWWLRLWGYAHLMVTAPQYKLHRCIDTFYSVDMTQMQAQLKNYLPSNLAKVPDEDLIAFCKERRSALTTGICMLEHGTTLILLLTEMLRRWCGDEQGLKYAALASGLRRNKTSEENIAVWKLSRLVRNDAELERLFSRKDTTEILEEVSTNDQYRSFRQSLDAFLVEYGHRGASERDPIYPRWRHNPRFLISQVKTLTTADESLDPTRTEKRLRERREATEKECFDGLSRQRMGWLKLRMFRFCLKWVQTLLPFRDDYRFHGDNGGAIFHEMFQEIGKRFTAKKLLANTDDIFFLGLQEIAAAAEGRLAARAIRMRTDARRRLYEKHQKTTPPMYLRGAEAFDSDVADESTEAAGVLRGFAASAGRVSGRARVCRKLEETEKIERGDVLIACATDPGWTPVFSILGALVVETGGILSHSTLVSREYGIPCVTNVNRATELIRDGSMVVVDGNQGRVFMHEEKDSFAEDSSEMPRAPLPAAS